MLQYSPRLEKPPESDQPSSASTLTPSHMSRNAPMPSPDAFGEPRLMPQGPFTNGNPMYSPGIPSASRSQERFTTPTGEQFQFPDAPPKLTINGKQPGIQSPSTAQSPGYPLSPDPFGQKTFSAAAGEAPPPPRGSSLPGSRFSQDSMTEEGAAAGRNRERSDSIISKGFRRLWRKSSASGMAAAAGKATPGANGVPPLPPMSPIPMSPHPPGTPGAPLSMAAQQAAAMPPVPQTPQSPSPSLASTATDPSILASPNGKRGSDLDPFHFDQESHTASRYPLHPAARAATISAASTVSTPPPPPTPTGSKRGVLKGTWTASVSSTNTGTTSETLVEEARISPAARKRPSILSMGRSRSGSIASTNANTSKRSSTQAMQTLQAFLDDGPPPAAAPPATSRSGGGFI
ncbi:hypothetical protein EXIGLDRAFT_757903 [Exidia glandulosa HHB12029]|uniref:Uncharacterized protein n=1 Tax=Exidia glandulosa HHB12029 TaxID=1314781 RepID=A0A165YZJ3_EXIGL|nr:hypothetical protein EXIGLDRAFT_757903 [Exidia glandulosa HHB12029]